MFSMNKGGVGALATALLAAASGMMSASVNADQWAAGDSAAKEGAGEVHWLRGDYGFTTTQACVRTPFTAPPAVGFDPVTRRLLVDGEFINAIGSGVMRFARGGTVTVENGVQTEILADQTALGQLPVSVGTRFACSGNYTVQPGGKLAVTLTCNVTSAQAGVSVVLGPFDLEGFTGHGKRSLVLSSVNAAIHTVTVSVGGNPVQQRERICAQSMSLTKL